MVYGNAINKCAAVAETDETGIEQEDLRTETDEKRYQQSGLPQDGERIAVVKEG